MYIQDISKRVTANTKIFVDDTKIKDIIIEEENIEKLQANLDKLFDWEEENNMKFNGAKFQLIRYGPNEDIKNNTLYFTNNYEHVIERFSSLRDLGVILSEDGRFEHHIEKVSKKGGMDPKILLHKKHKAAKTLMENTYSVSCRILQPTIYARPSRNYASYRKALLPFNIQHT